MVKYDEEVDGHQQCDDQLFFRCFPRILSIQCVLGESERLRGKQNEAPAVLRSKEKKKKKRISLGSVIVHDGIIMVNSESNMYNMEQRTEHDDGMSQYLGE